ncbi:MAG: hypothetical protein IJ087_13720, partial [Eggerthellaceae bacterium]|nr:hypothetical protein [Eggerthellaceae bacterium]
DEIENGINELLSIETNYQMPILTISNRADEEEMSEIFVRVNSGGTKLNEDDFIMTLLSVYGPDMRQAIECFAEQSRQPMPGTSYNALLDVKSSHLIRSTVGLGFRRGRLRYARLILNGKDLATRETSPTIREQNFTGFRESLTQVMNLNDWHGFINSLGEAGYINSGMISSENSIPLTYSLYLIGKHQFGLSPTNLQRFARRWYFMAALTSMYAGSYESVFESQLNAIHECQNEADFQKWYENEISARLTGDYFEITLPGIFDAAWAKGPSWNAFLASQIILGGKVLFNTQPISQLLTPGSSSNKKSYDKHHIFPDAFMRKTNLAHLRNKRANFVCIDYQNNIDISDDPPEDYVPRYREMLGEEFYLQTCRDNALPVDFENMGPDEFLEKRRFLMASLVKDAFMRL